MFNGLRCVIKIYEPLRGMPNNLLLRAGSITVPALTGSQLV